ncbi:hypothetical protein ACFWN2_08720 [Lentzea sp. NPDC058436]|uniref:hypothetical protein n=1 Tax=Lentzea sp. NPDC058436 TaxID=3346499 RepID=UPI003647C7B2
MAALVALLAFLTEFVKGRSDTRSFRPVVGWSVAIVSSFALVVALYALQRTGLSPIEGEGRALGTVAVASILLVAAGILTAVLTPSVDRSAFRELASAVEAFVQGCDPDDRLARSNRVALGLKVSYEVAWSGSTTTSRARDLGAVRLPTAAVAVLAGPSGSGKSVELRSHIISICRRAKQHRRPRELAVYVSVRMLKAIEGKITQDTIAEQLSEAVRQDNRELGSRLLDYLNGRLGPSWFFAFDLDGELTREQETEYFEAVRNFMRHRDRDRAVIAVRRRFPDAQPVCTPCEPTPQRVRELLHMQDIVDVPEGMPQEIAASPAMIMQFGAPTKPLAAVLDSFVAQSFRHNSLGESTKAMRAQAEDVAFRLLFNASEPVLDREMEPLLRAGLGRVECGSFSFRYEALHVHLAASHLARSADEVSLTQLCQGDLNRAVLLDALRCGGEGFLERLLKLVEEWVNANVDVPEILDTTLPPAFKFTWPPTLSHVFGVLCVALDEILPIKLSSRLQHVIDHLVWLGMFGGSRTDRERTLVLLGLASPGRVLDLYRQAVALGIFDIRTMSLIALHIRQSPADDDRLTLQDRVLMLIGALLAWTGGQFFPKRRRFGEPALLLAMMRGVIATNVAVSAVGSMALFILGYSGVGLAVGAVFVTLSLFLAFLAWKVRSGPQDLSVWAAKTVFWSAFIGVVAAAYLSLIAFFSMLNDILSRDFASALIGPLLLWLFSWPVAMLAQVVHDPFRQRGWLLPQQIFLELPAYRSELTQLKRMLVRMTSHLRSPRRWIAIGIPGAVIASLTYDLPIPGETEIGVDGSIAMVSMVAIGVLLVRAPRAKKVESPEVVGRQIVDGTMTSDLLLHELATRAEQGSERITELLKMLASAPRGALFAVADVLNSFEKLLEFLEHTLPTPLTRTSSIGVVKRGLWLYAPAGSVPQLVDLAVSFDKEHSGLLVRLAHSKNDRKLLSDAIKAATS